MLNVSLDLSNPCNLNCAYCFIEEKSSVRKLRRPDELTVEETMAILDDFAGAGARTVNLVGAGEPTIDPHFETIIDAITARHMTPVVFTNGLRFSTDHRLVRWLYQKNCTIVIKYNSSSAAVEDAIVGRSGYTRAREQAVELLRDAGFAGATPTRLGFDTVAFGANYAELPEIHRLARTRNIYPIIADYIPTGRTNHGLFDGNAAVDLLDDMTGDFVMSALQPLSALQRAALVRKLSEIDAALGVTRSADCAYYSGGRCTQLLGLYVDILGHIWPCVARQWRDQSVQLSPIGFWRDNDRPSLIWRSHPYLRHLRNTYTGACPYKNALRLS